MKSMYLQGSVRKHGARICETFRTRENPTFGTCESSKKQEYKNSANPDNPTATTQCQDSMSHTIFESQNNLG